MVPDEVSATIRRISLTAQKRRMAKLAEEQSWTSAEDATLRQAIHEHGNDWATIQRVHFAPRRSLDECIQRWSFLVNPSSRKKVAWSQEEDAILLHGHRLYPKQWARIASMIPGRSNQQVKQRWTYVLNSDIKNGPWDADEDRMLRVGFARFDKQWAKIAETIPGRTNIQCRNRWKDVLDPNISNHAWSTEDDARLELGFVKFGSRWSKIADTIPGRTGLQCRDRFLRRHDKKRISP